MLGAQSGRKAAAGATCQPAEGEGYDRPGPAGPAGRNLLASSTTTNTRALSLTFNAMMSGRLTAEELNEFATGALWSPA